MQVAYNTRRLEKVSAATFHGKNFLFLYFEQKVASPDGVEKRNIYVIKSYFSWDETINDFYYFNIETGETQWCHPLDDLFKQKVIIARQGGPVPDSKTTENQVGFGFLAG